MKYQIGTILVDLKRGERCHVDHIVTTHKGTLYTVQFSNGDYRRYYETSLNERFYIDSVPSIYRDMRFVLRRLVS